MGSGASNMGSGLASGVGVMGGMSLTGLSVPSSLGSPRPPVALEPWFAWKSKSWTS